MGFQTSINTRQSYAVEGDFAATNNLETAQGVEAAYSTGLDGIKVGTFAWVSNTYPSLVDNFGSTLPLGFVARQQRAINADSFIQGTLLIKKGIPISVFRTGDFWARNNANNSVTGHKVYANINDGTILSAPEGSSIPEYVDTSFRIVLTANQGELTIISGIEQAGFFDFNYLTDQYGNFLIDQYDNFLVD